MATTQTFQPVRRWRRYQLKARLFHSPFAVIPLINIFILMFFFTAANSASVLKPGINVQLPSGAFREGAPYNSTDVVLTQEGMVFFNDERLPIATLGDAFRLSLAKQRDGQLNIEADARVPYDSIIRVLNIASAAGFSNIYLSVRPTFGEEIMP